MMIRGFVYRCDQEQLGDADTRRFATHSYTPYYPGDQYVDWIGLSVYHYSIPAPDKSPPGTPGTNTIPRSGLAESLITGDDLCDPSLPVWSISRMAEKSGKPLAVPETGAVFYTTGNVGGPKEVDVKGAWWRQVLDLGGVGGVGVKMLLWFGWYLSFRA